MRPQLQEAKASKKDAEVVASFQLYKLEEPFAPFFCVLLGGMKHEKNNLTTVKKRKEKTVTPESEEKRSVRGLFSLYYFLFGPSHSHENSHEPKRFCSWGDRAKMVKILFMDCWRFIYFHCVAVV